MMEKNAKIYVAGHRGMVGSAIVRELKRQGYENIITRTHKELDLSLPFQFRLAVYIPPPLIRRKNSNRVEYNVHFSSYVGTFSIFPFIFRQKEKSHRSSDQ